MNHPSKITLLPEQRSAAYQDETSLLELWDIIVRRKMLIISSLLLALIAAGAYLIIAPPVYEASATLRIGQVAESGQPAVSGVIPLEDPDVLSVWLLGKYGEEIATGVRRGPPFLKKISVQKGSKTVVELLVRGITPEQSADFLRAIASDVIERHRGSYNSQVTLAQRRIEQIESRRRLLTNLFSSSADLLETLKQRDPVQASLLTLERGRLASELSETERELPTWQQKLNPLKTVMTEILGDIPVPAEAASPKKTLVIALATALGLMGGVMLAFATEALARTKTQRSSTTPS